MPQMSLRFYSALFKTILKLRFENKSIPLRQGQRPTPPDAAFVDSVATKDVVIDELTNLTVRIFLPDSAIQKGKIYGHSWVVRQMASKVHFEPEMMEVTKDTPPECRSYGGYVPQEESQNNHKLPVVVQFHAGGFVVGSKDSVANDTFCRRLAKMCNAIVIAVGYRLAPEHKCPAAYEDGYEVLQWLARQAELVANDTSPETAFRKERKGKPKVEDIRNIARSLVHDEMVDPWLAMHADVSRVVLVGASAGGNIADHVTRRASTPEGSTELRRVNVIGQVLLYPLFFGKIPTVSEMRMGDTSYFFDRSTLELVWRLFLPVDDFSFDHPAVNPLIKDECPPGMPPTLIVAAELDMLTERAMAYAEFLKKFGVDAQVNDYKDCVHGFATAEPLIGTPQAQSCAEDISVWIHKHISTKNAY